MSQAATIRVGTSYSEVYTRWSEYNGAYQRNYYEEEWLMVGAFIDQRFSLGTNNQGLFVAWNAELWPGISYKNWRDDGGFAFGVRPGFSLGYEGSLEDLHISAALNGGLTWTLGTVMNPTTNLIESSSQPRLRRRISRLALNGSFAPCRSRPWALATASRSSA